MISLGAASARYSKNRKSEGPACAALSAVVFSPSAITDSFFRVIVRTKCTIVLESPGLIYIGFLNYVVSLAERERSRVHAREP